MFSECLFVWKENNIKERVLKSIINWEVYIIVIDLEVNSLVYFIVETLEYMKYVFNKR